MSAEPRRYFLPGGGCYGRYYVRQFLRGRDRGLFPKDSLIVVIDRDALCAARREFGDASGVEWKVGDWGDWFDEYFEGRTETSDKLIRPPLTPHLASRWLERDLLRSGITVVPRKFPLLPEGIPFARQGDASLGLSHAGWVCPVNCIEPDRCPHTRGPRDSDMSDTVHRFAGTLSGSGLNVQATLLFACLHEAFGVGTYPLQHVIDARKTLGTLAESGASSLAIVGTISHCHGAIDLVEISHLSPHS